MGRLYRVVDTVVVIVCLPFYAVVAPLMLLGEWFRQRRKVRVGLEVTHWPLMDVREDFLISRCLASRRGVRWHPPSQVGSAWPRKRAPYDSAVEFIPVPRFWVPEPFHLRGGPPA